MFHSSYEIYYFTHPWSVLPLKSCILHSRKHKTAAYPSSSVRSSFYAKSIVNSKSQVNSFNSSMDLTVIRHSFRIKSVSLNQGDIESSFSRFLTESLPLLLYYDDLTRWNFNSIKLFSCYSSIALVLLTGRIEAYYHTIGVFTIKKCYTTLDHWTLDRMRHAKPTVSCLYLDWVRQRLEERARYLELIWLVQNIA